MFVPQISLINAIFGNLCLLFEGLKARDLSQNNIHKKHQNCTKIIISLLFV